MPARAEVFTVFAPCPQGLEEALTAEMRALGYEYAEPARAGCRFHADWTGVQRANLYSRLATRILVQLSHGPAATENDIFDMRTEAHTYELQSLMRIPYAVLCLKKK